MNLSPLWASYFETEGWKAKHWSDIGSPNAPDRVIMEWAKKEDYIVFTHDLDFKRILALTNAIAPIKFFKFPFGNFRSFEL